MGSDCAQTKGGSWLRKLYAIIGTALFVCLLALCCAALVEGPEPAAPPETPVHQALLLPAAGEVAETVSAAGIRRTENTALRTGTGCPDSPVTPVSDRNGRPLARGTYVRMVYEAFPPEGVRG